MKYFPGMKRRMELYTKSGGLSAEEQAELEALHLELEQFKKTNPDYVPGAEFKVSLGDLLKTKVFK